MPEVMKWCNRCKRIKTIDHFYVQTKNNKHFKHCKKCHNGYITSNRARAVPILEIMRCNVCKRIKALDNFYIYTSNNKPSKHCKKCHNRNPSLVYNSTTKNRKLLLKQLKDVPCMDCGERYPSCVMDFDHREGTVKLCNVGGSITRSLKVFLTEITKCDVVCSNCHRIRTWIKRKNKSGRPRIHF